MFYLLCWLNLWWLLCAFKLVQLCTMDSSFSMPSYVVVFFIIIAWSPPYLNRLPTCGSHWLVGSQITLCVSHFVCQIGQLWHFCKCKLGYLCQVLYGLRLHHLKDVFFHFWKTIWILVEYSSSIFLVLEYFRVLLVANFDTRVFSSSNFVFEYSSISLLVTPLLPMK